MKKSPENGFHRVPSRQENFHRLDIVDEGAGKVKGAALKISREKCSFGVRDNGAVRLNVRCWG